MVQSLSNLIDLLKLILFLYSLIKPSQFDIFFLIFILSYSLINFLVLTFYFSIFSSGPSFIAPIFAISIFLLRQLYLSFGSGLSNSFLKLISCFDLLGPRLSWFHLWNIRLVLRIQLLIVNCLSNLLWTFILLKDIVIIHSKLFMNSCNRFW